MVKASWAALSKECRPTAIKMDPRTDVRDTQPTVAADPEPRNVPAGHTEIATGETKVNISVVMKAKLRAKDKDSWPTRPKMEQRM
jgi:hypothetical protein